MRLERVEDSNKIILFRYKMVDVMVGGGDFCLFHLPSHGRYETEGFASYDGYIRNQYDNFEEAWEEFSRWVDERLPHVLERYKNG